MRKSFFLFLFLFLPASCGLFKRYPPVIATDSVYVEKIVEKIMRDTVIKVVIKDSIVFNTFFPKDTSHLETQVAESEAWISIDGTLNHILRNKHGPFPVAVSLPQYKIYKKEGMTRTVYVETEKPLTMRQSFLIVMGKIFFVVIIIIILMIILIVAKKIHIFTVK